MIPLLATGVGLGICIRLEYVMWTQLSKPCPLCMTAHLANLLLFVLLILLWPRESESSPATDSLPETPQNDLPPPSPGSLWPHGGPWALRRGGGRNHYTPL
jgi:hypothetical protein